MSFRAKYVWSILAALMLGSCCTGSPDYVVQFDYHGNSVIIPSDTVNLKIFMDVNHVENYAYQELGHRLKSELIERENLEDTVRFTFYIRKSYYKGGSLDPILDSILNVKEQQDSVEVYFDYNSRFDSTSTQDYQVLTRGCACSLGDPYVMIDSVTIEYDPKKTITVTDGNSK